MRKKSFSYINTRGGLLLADRVLSRTTGGDMINDPQLAEQTGTRHFAGDEIETVAESVLNANVAGP